MPYLPSRAVGLAKSGASNIQSQSAPSSPTVRSKNSSAGVSHCHQDQPGPAPIRRASSLQVLSRKENLLGAPFKDVTERYVLGKQLGEGVSGTVRLCVSQLSGERFACKTILKSSLITPSDVDGLRNEVQAMLAVREHPATISLRDVCEDSKAVHLLMDYCEGGDLFDRIKQLKRYSERDAARVCRILISVLQHCNANGIMHRDFKPENILMTSAESNTSIKVADFGQAAYIQPGKKLTAAVGTGYYIAPEVLNRAYGPEADVWSIGVILYILLSGKPPFYANDSAGVFAKVRAGVYDLENGPWRNISEAAKDLVAQMLCMDPAERITPEEIKSHPWVLYHCTLKPEACHMAAPPTNPALSPVTPNAKKARFATVWSQASAAELQQGPSCPPAVTDARVATCQSHAASNYAPSAFLAAARPSFFTFPISLKVKEHLSAVKNVANAVIAAGAS